MGMWTLEDEKLPERPSIQFDPKRRAFDQAADKWFSPTYYSRYEWYETRINESVVESDPSSPPAESLLWEPLEDPITVTSLKTRALWAMRKS